MTETITHTTTTTDTIESSQFYVVLTKAVNEEECGTLGKIYDSKISACLDVLEYCKDFEDTENVETLPTFSELEEMFEKQDTIELIDIAFTLCEVSFWKKW